MTVLLSLCAAVAYGLSDFVGGVVSRRITPWTIAFTAQAAGSVAILAFSTTVDGSPRAADAGWAVVAGLGNGVGVAFLYRGLAGGRMGVVAPISGVGAALVPLLAGVLGGERPGTLAWLGIAAALPAIWLVAREPDAGPAERPVESPVKSPVESPRSAAGVVDGVAAGLGFGILFAALGQIPDTSGLLPLALNQAIGTVVVVALATAMRQSFWPRRATAYLGAFPGVLGASATVLFLAATQTGLLTIAAVIASLYPAFTVLLAAALLRERLHRTQGVGLLLCGVAVALIAVS
ncbi:MAG: DMT family transporter [Nocardioides sp.]